MATYNLDQTDLKHAINGTIDHSTQQQILDYLINAGIGYTSPDNGATIPVQEGAGITNPDPNANVLIETNPINTVNTDANLKAIIEDTNKDVTLTVNGSTPVLVATGHGNDQVFINNTGDTTVLTGSGNDTIFGGAGHDSIDAGSGNDVLVDNVSGSQHAGWRQGQRSAVRLRCRHPERWLRQRHALRRQLVAVEWR
ncbi:hypothetical protein [Bradyrhizobium sp. USDA 4508]